MAVLPNDTGALRLELTLVQLAAGARDLAPPHRGAASVLVSVGIDYQDHRDGEWWPIVRLPPHHLTVDAVEQLLARQASLLRGVDEGFVWRPAEDAAIALQVVAVPGGATVEVGLDLGPFLSDVGGVAPRRDADLALFRFRPVQADLVRFADALAKELEGLTT